MRRPTHPVEPEELMAYLDGELPLDRAASAATHLERCAECQGLAAYLRASSQGLLAWQVESAREGISPALSAALAERGSRRTWRERMSVRPWVWGVVGAGLVVLLVAIPVRNRNQARMVENSVADSIQEASRRVPQAQPVPPAEPLSAPAAPMVARTATLVVTTREFDRARAGMDEMLKIHHGYLASLNISAPAGAGRSLTATLRVPDGELAAALTGLKPLGRVESEQQNGEEVSEQYVDLESRLANARNTELRLTNILRDRTGKLSDVLDVERELDRVRGEIERMDAEKKGLAKRVDFATLTLTVNEVYQERLEAVPGSTAGRFRNAAVEGYRNMVAGVVGLGLLLATAGPTVLLWAALLFFPVRWAWRRWKT